MKKTAVLHTRIDPELKENVEEILTEIGLTPALAVNLFFKQIELRHGLPFELKSKKPNKETLEAIEEAKRLIANPNTKRYTDMDELWKALTE